MILRRSLLTACVLVWSAGNVSAADTVEQTPLSPQKTEKSLFDPARHMKTSEVTPGMKGYGLSVFSGTKIEKFDVEVISVLHNLMGPKQDVVLIRATGQGLEHSGSVAGMSGSPIYLYDNTGKARMIGAFALGWEYCKDPIAGVRPIEEMLNVPSYYRDSELNAPALNPGEKKSWSLLDTGLIGKKSPKNLVTTHIKSTDFSPTSLRPLATPVLMSGVSQSFIDLITPRFAGTGFIPLQAGGAGDAPAGLPLPIHEPGSAIGVPIVTGDLDAAAIGTTTEVIGNRVFAFGHEFNAEGAVDLPMGPGYIHTVIPNVTSSFKMGSLMGVNGSIYSDESTAIAGQVGKAPSMIPIEVTVTSTGRAEPHVYKYNVVRHNAFTMQYAPNVFMASIAGFSHLPQDCTVQYDVKFDYDNGKSINISNITTSASALSSLTRDISLPVQAAMTNPFKKIQITKITGTMKVLPTVDAVSIISATPAKLNYKPGDTVRIFMKTRAYRGADATQVVELPLAKDLPDGEYHLLLGDADSHINNLTTNEPFRFVTNSVDDVFDILKAVTALREDKLYLSLALTKQGVALGRTALRDLPASRQNLLLHSGRHDIAPFVQSTERVIDMKSVVSGSAEVQLIVSRNPLVKQHPQPGVQPNRPIPVLPVLGQQTQTPPPAETPEP